MASKLSYGAREWWFEFLEVRTCIGMHLIYLGKI